jgi:hypothetical protein
VTAGALARRLIAAAGLGLGLAASAAGVEYRPDPDACRAWPASYYPIDPEERRPRASRPDEIVVPVAIHFMNADVPEAVRAAATYDEGDKIAKPGQRVQDIWTRQNVRRFFKQDGLINEVLAVLDVRLALVRVEECRYDPGRLRGDGQQVDWIYALTDPQTRLFDTPARCAYLLAHEFGHALTLRHVCRATASARDPDADLKVGVCGADDTKWLMHPLYRGKRVSSDEKGQVRGFALPFFIQP